MIFKENYTTASLKASVIDNKDISIEDKEKENKKIEVSNDAFLQAEMTEQLINKIEHARISGLMRGR